MEDEGNKVAELIACSPNLDHTLAFVKRINSGRSDFIPRQFPTNSLGLADLGGAAADGDFLPSPVNSSPAAESDPWPIAAESDHWPPLAALEPPNRPSEMSFNNNYFNIDMLETKKKVAGVEDLNNSGGSPLLAGNMCNMRDADGFSKQQLAINGDLFSMSPSHIETNGEERAGFRPLVPYTCTFCLKAGEPDSVVHSHRVRDEQGDVECRNLASTQCLQCGTIGHTSAYCNQEFQVCMKENGGQMRRNSSAPGLYGNTRTPGTSPGTPMRKLSGCGGQGSGRFRAASGGVGDNFGHRGSAGHLHGLFNTNNISPLSSSSCDRGRRLSWRTATENGASPTGSDWGGQGSQPTSPVERNRFRQPFDRQTPRRKNSRAGSYGLDHVNPPIPTPMTGHIENMRKLGINI